MVLVLVVGFLLLYVFGILLGKGRGVLMGFVVNWYRNREVNFKDELQYVRPSLPCSFPYTVLIR